MRSPTIPPDLRQAVAHRLFTYALFGLIFLAGCLPGCDL